MWARCASGGRPYSAATGSRGLPTPRGCGWLACEVGQVRSGHRPRPDADAHIHTTGKGSGARNGIAGRVRRFREKRRRRGALIESARRTPVKHFEFHPELFRLRNVVLETLSEAGFAWL